MELKDINIPECYMESADFRFFIDWISTCFEKIKYDQENMIDLYDPLRCKSELLWMLADTRGYRLDDRLSIAFNRLVLLYFISMIKLRGSKDGVTLAAEVNLAQFNLDLQAKGYTDENGNVVEGNDILYERLEDTSIPVDSVYVTPHTEEGYIDVVYFSTEKPLDACIEYVRPVGMYVFEHAGVRFDARTKISVDARLTDERDTSNWKGIGMSFGSTQVGHYSREDYARLQKTKNAITTPKQNDTTHTRRSVWYRNSEVEGVSSMNPVTPDASVDGINPGYRALYSLQLCNNEQIMKALIDPIFSLGYGPQEVGVTYPDNYLKEPDQPLKDEWGNYTNKNIYGDKPVWNLRYDKQAEDDLGSDVDTIDEARTESIIKPRPAVNPIMSQLGDAISRNEENTVYTKNENGTIVEKPYTDV